MGCRKILRYIILSILLVGGFRIEFVRALGTPQIVNINPSSPAQVGACVTIRARVDWDSEFRSMRIRFGNEGWQESSEIEFERNFCTNNYSPGWYTIRVEVAGHGDNDWANPRVAEAQYELIGQPEPSKGPGISQFSFSPSDGAIVGDSINIHIRVDSNNPGATTLTADCGWLSKNETSEVEFDSTWNTNGCPAQNVSVLACSRAVDDPNWTNASCTSRSYTLASPQNAIPAPSAELWADKTQLSFGECAYLHWQTTNAERVDIDGNAVQNSGDQEVCPTVTKKYSLTASNQSGDAKRNLTINVSGQSTSPKIADYFRTDDIIQIGYDIFVIVNGERRLLPNPETLDALGISRNWINNKGFSDSELKTIPRGQDIPDVNLDPSGFAIFKNQYFSNTNPITPGTEAPPPILPNQPPGQGQVPLPSEQWRVGKRIGLCQGAQIRTGSGFDYQVFMVVPENNWQVDIINGPRYSGGVAWWDVSRAKIDGGGSGWVYSEQAGFCNFNDTHENTEPNTPTVNTPKTNTVETNPLPLIEPAPWWLEWLTILLGGNEVQASANPFTIGQCTWYVAEQRPDVLNWLPTTGRDAKTWANFAEGEKAQQQGIFVIRVTDENKFNVIKDVQNDYIVVLDPDCHGANKDAGHVALVESVDVQNNEVHVSESNGLVRNNYGERDLSIKSCMSFISTPQPQTNNPNNETSEKKSPPKTRPNFLCKLLPSLWFCKTGK